MVLFCENVFPKLCHCVYALCTIIIWNTPPSLACGYFDFWIIYYCYFYDAHHTWYCLKLRFWNRAKQFLPSSYRPVPKVRERILEHRTQGQQKMHKSSLSVFHWDIAWKHNNGQTCVSLNMSFKVRKHFCPVTNRLIVAFQALERSWNKHNSLTILYIVDSFLNQSLVSVIRSKEQVVLWCTLTGYTKSRPERWVGVR